MASELSLRAYIFGVIDTAAVQGSTKVPSDQTGQEDFPAEQVTFHSHLPTGQGIRQAVCQLNH